jgi:uncharacterized repeat protein (TIGR01451 family)
MVPSFRRLLQLAVILGPAVALGCFGKSHNPSYFPWLLPPGDIIPTHAKPPGRGYYADFDPHAIRLEVRPLETTSPVRNHQVLIATVYDAQGKPRRARRVEWMVEGVGNIIEVDESGYHPGRGYKINNQYAVSYTNFGEHLMTRGNHNALDDFMIRPGQSWCVVSSAVEGDTHVTVYAPEIFNWESNKVTVGIRWVDAGWMLPQPAPARAGTQQTLATTVIRHSDKQPLANYRVRYRILDGPPALFLDTRGLETVATSDLNGHATATLVQPAPQQGANRIAVEIIRPPDPNSPSGVGVTIGRGEIVQQWLGPALTLDIGGPGAVSVGQEVTYTVSIRNPGQIETQPQTVSLPLPDGLRYVRSEPAAVMDGNQLTWTLGTLAAGQSHTLQATFTAARPGPATATAQVSTLEGLRDQRSVTTQVTSPQLKVALNGPAEAVLGTPFIYQVAVSNPGDGPLTRVVLTADLSPALEHERGTRRIELDLGALAAGETRTVSLALTPRQVGELAAKVTATAEGNLQDTAERTIVVRQASISLDIKGPKVRYVNRPAEWTIEAANTGEVAIPHVVLRTELPTELAVVSASDGAQSAERGVVWNLGTMQPKEQRAVKLVTNPTRLAERAAPVATVSGGAGVQAQARAELEIRGLPALATQIEKLGDPVAVGGRITYRVTVINTGSLPANDVTVEVTLPRELLVVSANGPGQPRVAGQQVMFPEVSGVPPRQAVRYVIQAEALEPGDLRVEVKVNSAGLAGGGAVTTQESTRVYGSPNVKIRPPANPPSLQPGDLTPPPPEAPAGSGAAAAFR